MDRIPPLLKSPKRRRGTVRGGGYSKGSKVSYGVGMTHPTPPSAGNLTKGVRAAATQLAPPARGGAPSATGLVCPAPIEALLAALSADITSIQSRLPGSPDLHILRRFRDDIQRALDEARRRDVWLSPTEVATATRKGVSTVTKECRDHGAKVGAVRNGKRSWLIHWPKYEAWMQSLVAAGRAR